MATSRLSSVSAHDTPRPCLRLPHERESRMAQVLYRKLVARMDRVYSEWQVILSGNNPD